MRILVASLAEQPVAAAVAERGAGRLPLGQRAARPPLLPGARSARPARVRALPPGHDGPRPRAGPPPLRAEPGSRRVAGDAQRPRPLRRVSARVAAGASAAQAVGGGHVAQLALV